MREIFEDLFENERLDPVAAARRGLKPQARKRFYKEVGVAESEAGFGLVLDGRPVKTPARRTFCAPLHVIVEAIADEWRGQNEAMDPRQMPLTRLANAIIDGVADSTAPVAAEIEKYL